AGAAVAVLLTAVPAVALAEEEPTPCEAATAALEDGQAKKDRLVAAEKALATARAEVAVLVKTYGLQFDVNTATAVDAENAVAYLRDLRNAYVQDGVVIDQPQYDKLSREMDLVKALRDALNEHQRAAEAMQAVDLAKLGQEKDEACAEGAADETPAPPTPPADDPADEDEDDEVIRNYEFNREETSQVGEVPVGGVDTGMA